MFKREETLEIGRYFINEILFEGKDPIKKYILKDKPSVIQKAKAKAVLLRCLKLAKKMKAVKASKEDLFRLASYVYMIAETDEYTMDLEKIDNDYKISELETRYL